MQALFLCGEERTLPSWRHVSLYFENSAIQKFENPFRFAYCLFPPYHSYKVMI